MLLIFMGFRILSGMAPLWRRSRTCSDRFSSQRRTRVELDSRLDHRSSSYLHKSFHTSFNTDGRDSRGWLMPSKCTNGRFEDYFQQTTTLGSFSTLSSSSWYVKPSKNKTQIEWITDRGRYALQQKLLPASQSHLLFLSSPPNVFSLFGSQHLEWITT